MTEREQCSAISCDWIVRRAVRSLIETFNGTAEMKLDEVNLKRLKSIVRRDSNLVEVLIEAVFKGLRHHSDCHKRLAALLIADHFFHRCHKFREMLISDIQSLLLYTAETDPAHSPLPQSVGTSQCAAKTLKLETLKIVTEWRRKFGRAYAKLDTVCTFLKSLKSVDFERLNAETQAVRERNREKEERKELLARRLTAGIGADFELVQDDLQRTLIETRAALQLLYPKFGSSNDLTIAEADEGRSVKDKDSDGDLELHGISDRDNLSIEIDSKFFSAGPKINRTDDNSVLLDSLRDSAKLLENYRQKLQKWLQKLCKVGCGHHRMDTVSKRMIDFKEEIVNELDKCNEIFSPANAGCSADRDKILIGENSEENSDNDNDGDLEDVPEKEGIDWNFRTPTEQDGVPEYILIHLKGKMTSADSANLSMKNEQENDHISVSGNDGHSISANKTNNVPTVAFGLDLKYWGDEERYRQSVDIPKNTADCPRFWKHPDESDYNKSGADIYRSRQMEFGGKYEPVERECRHPLVTDGQQLCNRRDRLKCPFHGLIIDRDKNGLPSSSSAFSTNKLLSNANIAAADQPTCSKNVLQSLLSNDTEYVKDIERATGAKLGGKCAESNRKISRNLINEKSQSEKCRDRLKSKLLDKKSLKRIGDTLDAIQQAKARRHFQHQFVYSMTKRYS